MVAALCTVPPLPHSPGPWPQASGGGKVPGWQNHPGSWSDRDSTVTLCSLCCLWKGCSNPISSAFHGCQLFAGVGRPVSEIGAIVRSLLPHVLIHPSCCPGPLCWLARPLPVASLPHPQLPHLPFYFGLQQARPGMHQPSPLGGREERRGRGEGWGLLDSTRKDLTKVLRLAANHRRGKEYLEEEKNLCT